MEELTGLSPDASLIQSRYVTAHRDGNRCLAEGYYISQLPRRLNSRGFPKTVTAPAPVPRAIKLGITRAFADAMLLREWLSEQIGEP